MKRDLFSLMFMAFVVQATAQDGPILTKPFRNELGLDITGFFRQFVSQTQNYYSGYDPFYFLTYRHHFKKGNIRAAIGGNFAHEQVPPQIDTDSRKYFNDASMVNARFGWEFKDELSKHWQVFYGADLRVAFSHSKYDNSYYNGGYANGSESSSQTYGLAPVLGLRYRISERLSLTTEASFAVNVQSSQNRTYYTPQSAQYPAIPERTVPRTTTISSSFSQPVALIVTIDL